MEKPAEHVYLLSDIKPTKQDADDNGNVLYFSPSIGWHQGYFNRAWKDDSTHWTYLPERPPAQEDPTVVLDRNFKQWVDDRYPNIEPAARMLLRLGFEAGYRSDRKNYSTTK